MAVEAHNLFSFTDYSYGKNYYKPFMPTITCPLVSTGMTKWISKNLILAKVWKSEFCVFFVDEYLLFSHYLHRFLHSAGKIPMMANILNLVSLFGKSLILTHLPQLDLRTSGEHSWFSFFAFSICHLLRLVFQNETFTANEDPWCILYLQITIFCCKCDL